MLLPHPSSPITLTRTVLLTNFSWLLATIVVVALMAEAVESDRAKKEHALIITQKIYPEPVVKESAASSAED